jgi:thiamine-phosphate pyrophosphorylase
MLLSVISPEDFSADEPDILAALFAAGLERYHVRKPRATAHELERWLRNLPREWRARLVLHSHHHLVDTLGLHGRHWGERGCAPVATTVNSWTLTSRACHDLPGLRQALGRDDIVLLSPVFASISKPGHAPDGRIPHDVLRTILISRSTVARRTRVFALGGVTIDRIHTCCELGFDGVAVLGAVWQAPDPIAAFESLREACERFQTPLAPAQRR